MRHRIDAGRETFAVFVADAPDGRGDLYAMTGVGSDVVQLTFTLPAEWRPRLSPGGDVVAFLRSRDMRDTLRTRVWLLNLLNGAERELALPDSSGVPEDLGWSDDGRALGVRTSAGTWSLSTPPAPPAAVVLPGVAAFPVRVGYPPFASIAPCADMATNLCVYPDSGTPAVLDDGARDAFRWGDDSVAYVRGRDVVIRPLGRGRSRTLRWREGLRNPREPDAFVNTGPTVRESP
jgi:hypothetical protein